MTMHHNSARKVRGRPFPKGHAKKGGRKRGTPNRVTQTAKAFAESVLADPQVQARMLADARRGKLPPAVFCLLMAYAWGKPKETIDVHGLEACLLYTSPSPRDGLLSRMPSSA